MSFHSARFEPRSPPYDRDALETHLAALPHAFADPHGAGTWHLSSTRRGARLALAERMRDPRRFPIGVLVRLRPDDVLIDQRAGADGLARGRELVAWLLARGSWRVVTEDGDLGVVTDADLLYAGHTLSDPATLVVDPFVGSPLSGRTWHWEGPEGGLAVNDETGEFEFGRMRGRLDGNSRALFREAVEHLELEQIDNGATSAESAVNLYWQDADGGDDEAWFDALRVPEGARPVATLIRDWIRVLRGWNPHEPLPAGFAEIAR